MTVLETTYLSPAKGRLGRALALAALLGLLAAPWLLGSYETSMLAKMMIYAIFAVSLNLLVGYTGIASLGHAAYFGAGGYAVALMIKAGFSNFYFLLLSAIAVSLVVAAFFAVLVLRAKGPYQLMITLALSQVLWGLAYSLRSISGGDDGIPGIPLPSLFPDIEPALAFYFVILLVFCGVVAASWAFANSPFGRSLVGIRENSLRMRILGYNVWLHKFLASIIAGSLAGLAGALLAWHNGFVGPGYLSVQASALVLIMVIVGGAGTVVGPLVGAFLLIGLESIVSTITDRWLLILGVIYILTSLFAPNGIAPIFATLRRSR